MKNKMSEFPVENSIDDEGIEVAVMPFGVTTRESGAEESVIKQQNSNVMNLTNDEDGIIEDQGLNDDAVLDTEVVIAGEGFERTDLKRDYFGNMDMDKSKEITE